MGVKMMRSWICLALAIIVWSCGKDEEKAAISSFSTIYSDNFSESSGNSCGTCHAEGGEAMDRVPSIPLDFSTEVRALDTLKNSMPAITECNTLKYVIAGATAKSLLLPSLFIGHHQDGFGSLADCVPSNRHHDERFALDEATIVSWIRDGANP